LGLWRWLREKGRVCTAADKAVDALAEAEKKVKDAWNDDLKKAYRELETLGSVNGNVKSKRMYEKARDEAKDVDSENQACRSAREGSGRRGLRRQDGRGRYLR
jgi:hypothetical protein